MNTTHPPTPRMTKHALQRCEEMGLRARMAKQVVQHAKVVYPGPAKHGENYIALSPLHPQIAVAFKRGSDGVPVIMTVLWHGIEYVRPSA